MRPLSHRLRRVLLASVTAVITLSCSRNVNLYDLLRSSEAQRNSNAPLGLSLVPYYRAAETTFNQSSYRDKADIIITVDNTGSAAAPFTQLLEHGVESLIAPLQTAGIDFKAATVKADEINVYRDFSTKFEGPYPIVTTSDVSPGPAERLRANIRTILNMYSGANEWPVSVIKMAIQAGENAGFHRDGAVPVYLIVSDADEQRYKMWHVDYILNFFDTLHQGRWWMMSAIGSDETKPCLRTEHPSIPFVHALVTRSDGTLYPICAEDYSVYLADAGKRIVTLMSETSLHYAIPHERWVDPDTIVVKANGVRVPRSQANGFEWNSYRRSVTFPGTYKPPVGAYLEVYLEYVEL